jgi:DNA-binding transcriptional MerR regulator
VNKAPEAFRTISEVAEDLALPQHVLRFWESRFPQVRPMKRGGGRRYYRPDDVDLLRGIRHLLYGEGYTIRGVQRILREQGGRFVQTVWQEGAPQPERIPELDGTESEAEGAGEEIAAAAADHDDGAERDSDTSVAGAAEPELDADAYGRREPSFGPAHGSGHGPPRAVPVAAASTAAAPIGAASLGTAAAREPAADPVVMREAAPARDRIADLVAPPPPGLSAADRERLAAVLADLEACRGRLAGVLAESGPAP